jgi:hypothetical protein
MRWYVSYPILAAGLAVGFDTFFPGQPGSARSVSPELVAGARAEPIVVPAAALAGLERSRLTAFSPGSVLRTAELGVAEPPRTSVLDYLAEKLAPLELKLVAAVAPAAQPITVTAWTGAVVTADTARAPTHGGDTPASRESLARDIQTELYRVGCYLGEVDGVWGSGSKRAAAMFMDRVNAALPTQEPDVFMLSLLRAQNDEVCGAACPRGQDLTASGRCVPSTLVAQSGKDRGRPADPPASRPWERTVVTAAITPPKPVPYGRMSIGGPKPEAGLVDAEAPAPAVTAAAYAHTVAIDDPDVVPDQALDTTAARKPPPTSFDFDKPPSVKKAKPSGSSKSARNRGGYRQGSYRHVQRLFENPLGRM